MKILIHLKRKLRTSFARCSKISWENVNHLHTLALSRIFYQVTKISGQKCHGKFIFSILFLIFFPPDMEKISDENSKRFHQEIKEMESRYQGRITKNMLADYCWFLQRKSDTVDKRQVKRSKHF